MVDKNIDKILGSYKVPKPSSNLSARIIAAAQMRKDVPLFYIILQEVADMFIIPRPAYALSFCLLLGVLLGWQNEIVQTTGLDSYMSFLNMDSSTLDFSDLEGGWL